MQTIYDDIERYEDGELDVEEAIDLFQELVITGVIDSLNQKHQLTAQNLIDQP